MNETMREMLKTIKDESLVQGALALAIFLRASRMDICGLTQPEVSALCRSMVAFKDIAVEAGRDSTRQA